MLYYKARIYTDSGIKQYGDLPQNYVIGYENELTEEVYFPMSFKLDEKYELVTEIKKEEYEKALEDISLIIKEKRQSEFEEAKIKFNEKKEIENRLLTADERYNLLDIENIPLEVLKRAKISQLGEKCREEISNGFYSKTVGYNFGFNIEHDQANFTQQMLLIIASGGNYTAPIQWKTIEGLVVILKVEEFLAIVNEATIHKISNQEKYWQLERQVLNSETNLEVDSINW